MELGSRGGLQGNHHQRPAPCLTGVNFDGGGYREWSFAHNAVKMGRYINQSKEKTSI
jgi:hypothetical protein